MLAQSYKPLLFLMALLLSACLSNNLDTLNKRFAAFEIGYKSALTQFDSLERSNSLKPETRAKVMTLIQDTNTARKAAYLAKDSGDLTTAENQLVLANKFLEYLIGTLPAGGQI